MQHPSFIRLISQAAPLNEWKHVVAAAIQASESLRITVLGISPTAGAGADNTAQNTPAVGWARRLHDSTACLAKHLLNMSAQKVHAMNAVGPDYFTWCTRGRARTLSCMRWPQLRVATQMLRPGATRNCCVRGEKRRRMLYISSYEAGR